MIVTDYNLANKIVHCDMNKCINKKKRGLFFTVEQQLINVEGMMGLEKITTCQLP